MNGKSNPIINIDTIGYWSEVKLDIVRKYASAYTRIMGAQTVPSFRFYYIDAFSGAGLHLSKNTGEDILGSPLNALNVSPPFHKYFLIDLDGNKTEQLKKSPQVKDNPNVEVFTGDCNEILLNRVFPEIKYYDYERALCLLDPYGLHLDWEVIREAGRTGAIEIFLNFPIMDMNRNALWRNPDKVNDARKRRMTKFWGNESWRDIAYSDNAQKNLFDIEEEVKQDNATVAKAFGERLRIEGEFRHVIEPMAMRNSNNAIVYYLFFATQKLIAKDIARDIAGDTVENIFNKYKDRKG